MAMIVHLLVMLVNVRRLKDSKLNLLPKSSLNHYSRDNRMVDTSVLEC